MSDMRDGICPKCGSDEVYQSRKGTMRASAGASILLGENLLPEYVNVMYYACADCGYFESYLYKDEDLDKIRQHWWRVGKRKKKNDDEG